MLKSPRETADEVATHYRRAIINGERPVLVTLLEAAIITYQREQKQPPTCDTHKRYKGKNKPKVLCEGCWKLYLWRKTN